MSVRRFLLISVLLTHGVVPSVFGRVECGPHEYRVAAYHRRPYFRGDGILVRESNVKEHCRSKGAAFAFWHPKLRKEKPESWSLPSEESTQWTVEEEERVMEVLLSLPPVFQQVSPIGIYRMRKATEPLNPASTTFGRIALYDIAFSKEYRLALVLTHELAHRLFYEISEGDRERFRMAAQWVPGQTKSSPFIPGRPKKEFLRENARLSPLEDFADDIAAYVHHPKKLKQTAPRVYDWIERTLGAKLKKGEKN